MRAGRGNWQRSTGGQPYHDYPDKLAQERPMCSPAFDVVTGETLRMDGGWGILRW